MSVSIGRLRLSRDFSPVLTTEHCCTRVLNLRLALGGRLDYARGALVGIARRSGVLERPGVDL